MIPLKYEIFMVLLNALCKTFTISFLKTKYRYQVGKWKCMRYVIDAKVILRKRLFLCFQILHVMVIIDGRGDLFSQGIKTMFLFKVAYNLVTFNVCPQLRSYASRYTL